MLFPIRSSDSSQHSIDSPEKLSYSPEKSMSTLCASPPEKYGSENVPLILQGKNPRLSEVWTLGNPKPPHFPLPFALENSQKILYSKSDFLYYWKFLLKKKKKSLCTLKKVSLVWVVQLVLRKITFAKRIKLYYSLLVTGHVVRKCTTNYHWFFTKQKKIHCSILAILRDHRNNFISTLFWRFSLISKFSITPTTIFVSALRTIGNSPHGW